MSRVGLACRKTRRLRREVDQAFDCHESIISATSDTFSTTDSVLSLSSLDDTRKPRMKQRTDASKACMQKDIRRSNGPMIRHKVDQTVEYSYYKSAQSPSLNPSDSPYSSCCSSSGCSSCCSSSFCPCSRAFSAPTLKPCCHSQSSPSPCSLAQLSKSWGRALPPESTAQAAAQPASNPGKYRPLG